VVIVTIMMVIVAHVTMVKTASIVGAMKITKTRKGDNICLCFLVNGRLC
jgi:hypothetical protein